MATEEQKREILERIREPQKESETTLSEETSTSLDIAFAQQLSKAGGIFVYCESLEEVVEALRSIKEENEWNHIFAWEPELKELFEKNDFQKAEVGFIIENSSAAISLCEVLIASDGTILLSSKQASRRRLPIFPAKHIILAHSKQLAPDVIEGLEMFRKNNKDELPSIIDLNTESTASREVESTLILNAQGPRDIFVILCDELLPRKDVW